MASAVPLATMHDEKPDEVDDQAALRGALTALANEQAWLAPMSAEARARVLAAASSIGRFERFVTPVAAMADVAETTARTWLDGVWGDLARWEAAAPGARAWWVEGGPRTRNALRGFVHIRAGGGLPHHAHLGDEHVLVLQGGARVSTGERLAAGQELHTPAGDAHTFAAIAGGADLLVFTVAHEGLDFDGVVVRPRP